MPDVDSHAIETSVNSVLQHTPIPPVLYASIVFCSLGLVIAFYVLIRTLGCMDKRRLQSDYHYRVRWIQTLILIVNRLCDMIKTAIAFVTDTWPGRWILPWPQYDEELKSLIRLGLKFYLVSTVTTYIIMLLVYFLTVDRYQRVAMVLPQTKLARFLKATQIIYTLCLVYIGTIFIVDYTSSFLGKGLLQQGNAVMRQLVDIRRLVELFFISTGIILDYAITIRLIVISTHTNHPASLVTNEEDPPEDRRRWMMAHKQRFKKKLAMRMILLLAGMAFIDTSMFTGHIIVNIDVFPFTETEMESLLSIIQSWISLRILLVYSLLDIFLSGLKQTDRLRPNIDRTRRPSANNNLLERLQHFLDSLLSTTISKQTRPLKEKVNLPSIETSQVLTESSKVVTELSFSPMRYRLHHESSSVPDEITQTPSYSAYNEHYSDMSSYRT